MTTDPTYQLEGAKWGGAAAGTPSGVITYSFATHDIGGEPFHIDSGLDPSFQADVRGAMADWSAVAGVTFQQVADSSASDIRIAWDHIDGPWNTVAQTWYNDSHGQMTQNWIGFDDSESYTASQGGHVLADGISFAAIAEHEIGHALGLAHDNAEPAIMNAVMSVNDLRPADVAGAEALYGGPAATDAPAATVASASASLTASASVPQSDHLLALPPLQDPSFGTALHNDIEQLAADHGVPVGRLAQPLQTLADRIDAAMHGHTPDAAGLHTTEQAFAALPQPVQQDLHNLLAQSRHGDWFHAA